MGRNMVTRSSTFRNSRRILTSRSELLKVTAKGGTTIQISALLGLSMPTKHSTKAKVASGRRRPPWSSCWPRRQFWLTGERAWRLDRLAKFLPLSYAVKPTAITRPRDAGIVRRVLGTAWTFANLSRATVNYRQRSGARRKQGRESTTRIRRRRTRSRCRRWYRLFRLIYTTANHYERNKF